MAQVRLLVLEVVLISEHLLDTKHIGMEELWNCPCQLRAQKTPWQREVSASVSLGKIIGSLFLLQENCCARNGAAFFALQLL